MRLDDTICSAIMIFQPERVDPRDKAMGDSSGQLFDDDTEYDADPVGALESELAEALLENEQLRRKLEQQQPIIKDFEKRAAKIITKFGSFIKNVKVLIDLLSAAKTDRLFWNLPIDARMVKLYRFCIVNDEMLTLMYNYPNFDREIKKMIEVIQSVHNTLSSYNLESQQTVSFMLIELHQALQILDLD